jgi:hypothetical protein
MEKVTEYEFFAQFSACRALAGQAREFVWQRKTMTTQLLTSQKPPSARHSLYVPLPVFVADPRVFRPSWRVSR